ncbi:hypothetical protein OWM54_16580 [Myxococcus sp. MISCRS1]|uniref:hypothetical protein n=1 Tax=Myxococcus sp. MISCRS1 TaxID=2996786 RepID=UPI0022706948|nr:hypothetical protein [Myxococcus sp. MISCRS1]MCY0998757.1 hypothetical protein [Myxococcus sp. MISCRS1]
MTRNVKRLRAFALPLSLAPTSGLAEPSWTETFVLPARPSTPGAMPLLCMAWQEYYVLNLTGVTVSSSGTLTPPFPNFVAAGGFASAGVFTNLPGTHQYLFTTNPSDPLGAAKTCIWQFSVTRDSNGVFSGVINQASAGNQGVLCTIDPTQSYFDPSTCRSQVVTYIQ